MDFGFTPNYAIDLGLDQMTPPHFMALALEAVNEMDWKVLEVGDLGMTALSSTGLFSWKGRFTIVIDNGLAHIKSESTGREMMDWGKNKKCVDRFVELFDTKKAEATEEGLEATYTLMKSREDFVSPEVQMAKASAPKMSFWSLFIPRKGFFMTPLIIDINILLFIIMVLSGPDIAKNLFGPDTETILKWGGNFRAFTLNGEWWRLFTCMFLHIGIMHLLLNMYALLYIGILLEPILGKWRFALAYLLTGLVASMTSIFWHDQIVSAGASGAIFGMYGVFLALITTNIIDAKARKPLLGSMTIFIGYNLLFGLKGGIDNSAHIGGLLSGFVIGYIFYPGLTKERWRYPSIAGSVLVAGMAIWFLYIHTNKDMVLYQKNLDQFTVLEKRALGVYELLQDTTNPHLLASIQDSGINSWNQGLKLMQQSEALTLPKPLKDRIPLFEEYCQARLDSYGFMYRKLAHATDADSSSYYETRVKSVLDELNGSNK
jgi:rhomboid protease GluP